MVKGTERIYNFILTRSRLSLRTAARLLQICERLTSIRPRFALQYVLFVGEIYEIELYGPTLAHTSGMGTQRSQNERDAEYKIQVDLSTCGGTSAERLVYGNKKV